MILRELRATSRQGQIFWMRVYSAGVAILTLLFLLANDAGVVGSEIGAQLFRALNFTLLITVLTAGPIVTADCISQERREGTLGLLFLTPLRAADIVISKFIIHSFRAFTMVLAVLPMMALPVVFGGVTGDSLIRALVMHVSALLVALCCGMIASVRNVSWLSAVVYAELFCGFAILFYQPFSVMLTLSVAGPPATTPFAALAREIVQMMFLLIPVIAILLFSFEHCRAKLRINWQDDRSTYAQPQWVGFFSKSDFWQKIFKWDKSKTLDRNPIAWLQEYNWTARLAKWGWCIFLLFGEMIIYLSGSQGPAFNRSQLLLGCILALGMSLSAANSFRRERETGGLELLLVTPLQNWQLIFGRAWGLWAHFFPAAAIFIFNWWFSPFIYKPNIFASIWLLTTYLSLPLVGLLISLYPLSVFISWVATFALGAFAPFLVAKIAGRDVLSPQLGDFLMILMQVALGILAVNQAFKKLSSRKFSWNYS